MTVRVYGSSDDLVEIEGDIDEEFPLGEDDESYIGLSDGTLLYIQFGKHGWVIKVLHSTSDVEKGTFDNDEQDPWVKVHANIEWVLHGDEYHSA